MLLKHHLVASGLVVLGLWALVGQAQVKLLKIPLTRGGYELEKNSESIVSYYATIGVGTPAKHFRVVFDTSLADSWIPHYTWNSFYTNLHYSTGYLGKDSTTSKKIDLVKKLVYRGTKLTGKQYIDEVQYATAGPRITTRQGFLAINDASNNQFKDQPYEGAFGLAPVTQSSNGVQNVLISLVDAGLISKAEFSLWINPKMDIPNGGELVLGGVDTNRYSGIFYYHKLNSYKDWQVSLQMVTLGQQPILSTSLQNYQVSFNAGITDIYGPEEYVQKIYDLITVSVDQDTGLRIVDCERTNMLPPIGFMIDGISYATLPSNYVRRFKSGTIFSNKVKCYLAIKSHNEGKNKWVLGTNFLSQYYTRFDFENRQIGFASLRN